MYIMTSEARRPDISPPQSRGEQDSSPPENDRGQVYEATIELSEEAHQELQERIEKRRQLIEAVSELKTKVIGIEEQLRGIKEQLAEVVDATKEKALQFGEEYGEDIAGVIAGLDFGEHKQLDRTIKELEEDWGLSGESYDFADEYVLIPAGLKSDDFPRISKTTEVCFTEYDPVSSEAILRGLLRYDDNPDEDTEYYVDIRIQLDQAHEGPFQAAAEIHLHNN